MITYRKFWLKEIWISGRFTMWVVEQWRFLGIIPIFTRKIEEALYEG